MTGQEKDPAQGWRGVSYAHGERQSICNTKYSLSHPGKLALPTVKWDDHFAGWVRTGPKRWTRVAPASQVKEVGYDHA